MQRLGVGGRYTRYISLPSNNMFFFKHSFISIVTIAKNNDVLLMLE
jgi:hypothetical protein